MTCRRWAAMTLWVSASLLSCRDSPWIATPHRPIHVIDMPRPLRSTFTYEGVVKLHVTPESALGGITRAIKDPRTGDLVVVDRESTRLVYRFDSAGHLRGRYGLAANGRSRFATLLDAVVLPNSDVVIFTDRTVAQFSMEGSIKREVPINFIPDSPIVVDDAIYVRALYGTRAPRQERHTIVALNADLTERGRFHPRDARVDKYAYTGRQSLAAVGTEIVVADVYDPTLTRYDREGHALSGLSLPPSDVESRIWTKEHLSEEERTTVRQNTHRFSTLFGVRGKLFLFEICRKQNLARSALLSLESGQLAILSSTLPFGPDRASSDTLVINGVVGGYENGLIGVINTSDQLMADGGVMARQFSVTLSDRDNPMLVFVRLSDTSLTSAVTTSQ